MDSNSEFSDKKKFSSMQSSFRKALQTLNEAKIRYLVGGAHALYHYTGIWRDTKDLDLFLLPQDHPRGLEVLEAAGYSTVLTSPHWLGKAIDGKYFIDIIFSSGNAISRVDKTWFAHAPEGEVIGVPVKVTPAEEMIWSKAFIMERERYDGADILHLLLVCGDNNIDWSRLFWRFGSHWRILYSHLILFGFVYPSEWNKIPKWIMDEFANRLEKEINEEASSEVALCRGSLLSKSQYKVDIEKWGYKDARLIPFGKMTKKEIAQWDNFQE